jgi:DNA-binding beta-propeller fold protein YncE
MQDCDLIDRALRRAYADLAATIAPDEADASMPASAGWQAEPSPLPRVRGRRLVPVTIAVAVVLIAAIAAVIPHALESGSRRAPVAAAGPPMAYVATEQDTVIPVSLRTGIASAAITLGVQGSIAGVVMAPDRKTLYIATVRGQVAQVDLTTGRAGRPIIAGGISQAMVMTPDGRTAYLLEPPYGVAVVNLAADEPGGFIKVAEASAFALTPDGATLYVVNADGSRVTPVDTETGDLQRPIATHVRSWLAQVAISPDGRTVYVAGTQTALASHARQSILTPISTSTDSAGTPIRLGRILVAAPITISPDGKTAYVTGDGVVVPVSLPAGTVGRRLNLPGSPFPYLVAVSPDSKVIYAVNGQAPKLYRIDAARRDSVTPISLGPAGQWSPGSVVFGNSGKSLYVLSWAEDQTPRTVYLGLLTPVDEATGKVGRPVLLRGVPAYVAFRP